MDSNEKIEKQVLLHAPISRVSRAVADAKEFGQWFGVTLTGTFNAGQTITGTFSKTLDENVVIEQRQSGSLLPKNCDHILVLSF